MLADGTRIQILWALVDREMPVNELADDDRQTRSVGVPASGEAADGPAGPDPAGGHPDLLPAGERPRPAADHRRDAQRRTRRPGGPRPSPRGAVTAVVRRPDRSGGRMPTAHDHSHDRRRPPARTPHDEHPHDPRRRASPRRGTHGPSARPCRGGVKGVLLSVFRPHSHDSADSVDSALEGSAQGIRAVKISLVALGVTAAAAGGRRRGQRVGRAAGRHHPQLLRRARPRCRCGSRSCCPGGPRPAATPTASAGPRTWPGCSSSR